MCGRSLISRAYEAVAEEHTYHTGTLLEAHAQPAGAEVNLATVGHGSDVLTRGQESDPER